MGTCHEVYYTYNKNTRIKHQLQVSGLKSVQQLRSSKLPLGGEMKPHQLMIQYKLHQQIYESPSIWMEKHSFIQVTGGKSFSLNCWLNANHQNVLY